MFYILFVPVSFLLLYQWYKLTTLKKHDVHLYRFCELRRNAISYLSNNYEVITREDYIALRRLIESLNSTVNNYKLHKNALFNYRLFVRYLGDYKKFEKESTRINTKNTEILKLMNRMHINVFQAFLAYTPFIKHEIALVIIMRLLKLSTMIGIKSLKIALSKVNEAKEIKDDFETKYVI